MATKEDFADFLHWSVHQINSLQFYFLNHFLYFEKTFSILGL